MSTVPNSGADSGKAGATPTKKKPRSPAERFIVWGLIVVLLLVCGVEAMARFGYTNSLTSLQTAMEGDSQGVALKLDDVSSHISGFPTRTEDEGKRLITYHWNGLLKDYGTIKLAYSNENEVMSLQTAEPPPEPVKPAYSDESVGEASSAPPSGSMTGGGGRGPGGGGGMAMGGPPGGFDPMSYDKDGDGKVSIDEAPEPMKTWYDEGDTNKDGFLDADEFQALTAARAGGGPGGAGEGGRPDRPQRPAEDAGGDPAEATDSPSADGDKPAKDGDTPSSEGEAAEKPSDAAAPGESPSEETPAPASSTE